MTIFTNSKLTDEYVSNATLIRLILWADQHNSHYVAAALRELQERRKADSVPVEINDDMAYAFHHALSDSSPGADEVEEIKTGLRAAFSNVTAQPAPVVPDEIEPDDGNTFDYVDGWNACRAAMLHGAEPVSQTYKLNELAGNYPVTPDGWVMVPKEPTQAMIKAWLSEIANFRGHAAGYRAALEAAPQLEVNRG
ncbi:TPA: hypothetical protein ACP2JN_003018 [Escherichia coli]|uniref:hypothetical protein n=2 Tax=Escherichia coli TaxID=562 RepID=UPI001432644C|nr:hypothetical protein [Escherichia coli]EIT9561118.1 hypothetical protein [Escherichia coli]EJA2262925.1 hypothetical protein [Escherichia coli]MCX0513448.1 hypothetical protein [Escherichia coli]MCX1386878.1 hypothetical protein [Escherichia coli]